MKTPFEKASKEELLDASKLMIKNLGEKDAEILKLKDALKCAIAQQKGVRVDVVQAIQVTQTHGDGAYEPIHLEYTYYTMDGKRIGAL